jgi:hypothetical protein
MIVYFIFLIILIIIIIYFIRFRNERIHESYISYIYTPSYFEENKIKLYVSKREKSDRDIEEYLSSKISFEGVYEDTKNFKGDFALLPETNIIAKSESYKLVMPIHTLSFSIITQVDNSRLKSFLDLNKKRICIWPKNGYTEDAYKEILRILNFKEQPKIVDYSNEEMLSMYLKEGKIDGICTLCNHPQNYIQRLSEEIRIKILNWKENKKLEYYLPNIHITSINFSKYRLFTLKKFDDGYGVKLSLYADEKIPSEAVIKLLEIYGERTDGKVKNWLLGFSQNKEFHNGTIEYLKKKGYFVNRHKENKACGLLAGNFPCEEKSELEETANLFYSRDFIYDDEMNRNINENGTIPFLIDTKKVQVRTNELMKRKEEEVEMKIKKIRFLKEKKEKINFGKILNSLKSTLRLRWQCYGKTEHRSKKVCERQEYTKEGVKKAKNIWDKPCISNKECPYYEANKNYKNKRGGCIRGYCEMPLGIQRKGFTLYKKSSKPICHGCNLVNTNCCSKKKGMASPDYVFLGDENSRISERKELSERNIIV